ncbi:MAG: ATP-dependent zinc metalloprotease FtsH [Candidatus Babeliaceae bacterium]|nr:ATP-dependent zinc metalloprotease FtsH [Candidatus Babeliaceae bacterium]
MKKNRFKQFPVDPRIAIFALLACAGLFLLIAPVIDNLRTIKVFTFSEFLHNIDTKQIKTVNVDGQEASGELVNGESFKTILPEGYQKDIERLSARNSELKITILPANQSNWWQWLVLFIGFAVIPVGIWFVYRKMMNPKDSSGGGIFGLSKNKARVFMPNEIQTRFSDIAGATEAKEALQDIIDYLKFPEKYKRSGAQVPRGVLFIGEPGNGKTLLAKALAGEAHCPFLSTTGSDFIEVFVGVGAARVRDLFAQARKLSPCIIFIDEIDAVGRERGAGIGGGNDEREQTLNQLLTELDGFDSAGIPVIVIAATNRPEVLDKALLRPGRFDRRIVIPFPDFQARVDILKIHARALKVDESVDFNSIAGETAGFSGADLAHLMNQAALLATRNDRSYITAQDIERAHKHILESRSTEGAEGNAQVAMFMPVQVKTKFTDVAGAYEAKEELQEVVDFLIRPEKYTRLGAQIPKGVLLTGDPGNGKTLLARAIAGESGRPFFAVSGSSFIEQYVGVGAKRVRELFAQARKHAPSIVFIDEIDAIGIKRSDSGGDREYAQTLNQLLTEMDGFATSRSAVIVIAATNRADILDKALLRPGRFDRKVEVPYPNIKAREEILAVHLRKVAYDPAVKLDILARATIGFSGAALANLVNEAAILAAKHEKAHVDLHDFDEARDIIMMGKQMHSKKMSPEELRMVAYHESGHALVALMIPEDTMPLYKFTILPRGNALGVAHYIPETDLHSRSKPEILAQIAVALGGRAAEDLGFAKVSTGALSDFEKATGMAHEMVRYFGMSDKLGQVVYDRNNGGSLYSEYTARLIDEEVKLIMDTQYARAIKILTDNRDKLEKLAETILEKETLYAEEVYALLGIKPRVSNRILPIQS